MNPATLTTFIFYLAALIGFGILFYQYTKPCLITFWVAVNSAVALPHLVPVRPT